jgi:hypothetical protein
MTDHTAPERLMAWADENPQWGPQWKCCPLPMMPKTAFSITEYIRADMHRAEVDALVAENARLREALTPSGQTKAAYSSEVECDHPTNGRGTHYVPWISIKAIMAMIRARAALIGEKGNG